MSTSAGGKAIASHFAVLCVMEDLIGSADAESESAAVEARARAVPQLSALACTMGRDWCENEIVPYLERIAREDERAVSVAAAEQIPSLCETKYFERSSALQNDLLLRVGVDLLSSSHAEVRDAAVAAVRRACAVISCQNYLATTAAVAAATAVPASDAEQLQQIKRVVSSVVGRQQMAATVAVEACTLLLYVVHRLLFEVAFPASLSSAMRLLAPAHASLEGYRCNPGFDVLISPLVLSHAVAGHDVESDGVGDVSGSNKSEQAETIRAEYFKMLSRLLTQQQQQRGGGADSVDLLGQLRLSAAICGGTGRVTLVEQAVMRLLSELLQFHPASSSSSSLLPAAQRDGRRQLEQAACLLLDHLSDHVFAVACPSAALLDTALPQLCACLHAAATAASPADQPSIRAKLSRLCARICGDWTVAGSKSASFSSSSASSSSAAFVSDDWAVRFELAKFAPQLFEALLHFSSADASSIATSFTNVAITAQELALGLLQHTLPRLVNDEEVEVSTAAAGSLPQLMAIAERRQVQQASVQQRFVLPPLPAKLSDVFGMEQLAVPAVQEAVAHALSDAVRGEKSSDSSNNNHGGGSTSSGTGNKMHSQELSMTAHNTLCEMLWSCEDDAIRAQIIEPLLWSSAMPALPLSASSKAASSTTHAATTMAMTPQLEAGLRSAIGSLLNDVNTTRWRTRDLFAAALGRMMVHLLRSFPPQHLHRVVLQQPGCLEFVVQPFVRLLLDRFYQVRSTALGEIIAAAATATSSSNATTAGTNQAAAAASLPPQQPLTRAQREPLWEWVSSLMRQYSGIGQGGGSGGGGGVWPSLSHYQTRVARLTVAVVCASEATALQLLAEAAKDNVPNVRRAVAQALSQGVGSDAPSTSAVATSATSANGGGGSMLPSRELIAGFRMRWSPASASRVLELLERLVEDESADVRESAAAGLSRCR